MEDHMENKHSIIIDYDLNNLPNNDQQFFSLKLPSSILPKLKVIKDRAQSIEFVDEHHAILHIDNLDYNLNLNDFASVDIFQSKEPDGILENMEFIGSTSKRLIGIGKPLEHEVRNLRSNDKKAKNSLNKLNLSELPQFNSEQHMPPDDVRLRQTTEHESNKPRVKKRKKNISNSENYNMPWAKLSNMPSSISARLVLSFFNSISVIGIYALFSNNSTSESLQSVDLYVEFQSMDSLDLAMQRSGENIISLNKQVEIEYPHLHELILAKGFGFQITSIPDISLISLLTDLSSEDTEFLYTVPNNIKDALVDCKIQPEMISNAFTHKNFNDKELLDKNLLKPIFKAKYGDDATFFNMINSSCNFSFNDFKSELIQEIQKLKYKSFHIHSIVMNKRSKTQLLEVVQDNIQRMISCYQLIIAFKSNT